jgi:coenzyme PQQ precursor peptide PqqA
MEDVAVSAAPPCRLRAADAGTPDASPVNARAPNGGRAHARRHSTPLLRRTIMAWTAPDFEAIPLSCEVTTYAYTA